MKNASVNIGRVLGLLAGVTYIVSVSRTSYIQANNLGLFSNLDWTFYLSLGLLFASFFFVSRTKKAGVGLLVYPIVAAGMLSALGWLAQGPNASVTNLNNYVGYFRAAQVSSAYGNIPSSVRSSAQIWGWPASILFYSIMSGILGLSHLRAGATIVALASVLFFCFDTLIVTLLAYSLNSRNAISAVIGGFAYSVGMYFVPRWLQDTGFAYSIFLVSVASLLLLRRNEKGQRILVSLLMVVSVLSNFYESIIIMAFVVVYALRTKSRWPLLVSIPAIGAWLIFGYTSGFISLFQMTLTRAFQFGTLLTSLTTSVGTGTLEHHVITASGLLLAAIYFIWAMVVMISARIRIGRFGFTSQAFLYILAFAAAGVIIGPSFGGENPIEALERVFIFAFPFVIAMMSQGSYKRLVPLVLMLLIVLSPLGIIASYGGLTTTYISPAEQASSTYIQVYGMVTPWVLVSPSGYGSYPMYLPVAYSIFGHYVSVLNDTTLISALPGATHSIGGLGKQAKVAFEAIEGAESNRYAKLVAAVLSQTDVVYQNPDQMLYYTYA